MMIYNEYVKFSVRPMQGKKMVPRHSIGNFLLPRLLSQARQLVLHK